MTVERKRNLTLYLHIASFVAFILFVGLGYLAFKKAADIADDTHKKGSIALVKNEISRQVEFMARDQSQISNWDETLKAITGDLDSSFVRREIAGWLWVDFDIHDSVIVNPAGEVIVSVTKSKVVDNEIGQLLAAQNQHLLEQTTKLYFENRKRTRSGFSFEVDPTRAGSIVYAHEFKNTDGIMSLFMAQAIVPSDGFTLADGNPYILLTRKLKDQKIFDGIEEKLGLSSFKLVSNDQPVTSDFEVIVVKSNGLKAVWNASTPSAEIWQSSRFLIVSLLALLAAILAMFAYIYGRALRQLENSDYLNAKMALHDPLTGLPNRAKLERSLEQIVYENRQEASSILCFDLNNFKLVNDTFGHQAGDSVLKEVAQRAAKVIGSDGMVARTGGDEFIILLHSSKKGSELLKLCDQLVSDIAKPIAIGTNHVSIAASVGVSPWKQRAMSIVQVIREADQALFKAKESGVGRTEILKINDKRGVIGQSSQTKAVPKKVA